MTTGFGRAQDDDVAARIAAALPGINIERRATEYAGATTGEEQAATMLRLRLGARAYLDLATGLNGWFVVPVRADSLGSTPLEQRQTEPLGISTVASSGDVTEAAVSAVRRWVEAFGTDADAPFTRALGTGAAGGVPQVGSAPQAGAPQVGSVPQAGVPQVGSAPQPFAPPEPPAQPFGGQSSYPTAQPFGTAQHSGGQQQYPAPQPFAAPQQYPTAQPYGGQQQYPAAQQYPTAQPYGAQPQYYVPVAPQPQYAPYVPVAPTKSRGWIVALAIGGSAVLLVIAVLVVFGAVWLSSPTGSTASDGDYAHEPADYGDMTAGTLVAGECFDFPNSVTVDDEVASWGDGDTELASRDCTQYHDFEAYSVESVDDAGATAYPGDDELFEQVDDRCYSLFASFVGTEYEDSVAEYGYLYPSESSWAEGDRQAVCFAYLPSADTDESLRDSGR